MSVDVRIATPADAASACDVLRRSILECCVEDHHNDAAILSAWLGNKTEETVTAWFSSPSNYSLVATLRGEVAGVGLLTRKGKIALCYVAPQLRFTGIGKALVQALEAQAIAWGLSTMQVASTLTAQAFYRRNGYAPIRETESCFGIEATLFSKKLEGDASAVKRAQYGSCNCSHTS